MTDDRKPEREREPDTAEAPLGMDLDAVDADHEVVTDEDAAADTPALMGYLHEDGGWVAIAELMGVFDAPDADLPAAIETLAMIDVCVIRRTGSDAADTADTDTDTDADAGTETDIAAVRLTSFADDLYDATGLEQVVSVYLSHGKEPPEDMMEAYRERFDGDAPGVPGASASDPPRPASLDSRTSWPGPTAGANENENQNEDGGGDGDAR